MADVSISIKDTASPMVAAWIGSMKDFREPLQTSGLYLQKSLSKQFAVGGKPKWKPLSPITIFYRRKWSTATLIDTGRLRRSYVSRGKDSEWRLTDKQLTIGSNLEYAELHQYGGFTTLHEKRWFKSGRKAVVGHWTNGTKRRYIKAKSATNDVMVTAPKVTKASPAKWVTRKRKGQTVKIFKPATPGGIPANGYKLKHVNSYKSIKVPARPLSIQAEDVDAIQHIFFRWIMKQVKK